MVLTAHSTVGGQGSVAAVTDRLRRELGVAGAVVLGMGSMVGTGVFVSLGLAVDLAGRAVVWAVVIAGFVALCNGLSSAQLAAALPVSGGTYEYGYHYLHPAAGFTAGWLYLIAKSASAATAALGIAFYLGFGADRLAGVAAVAVVTGLVLAGIRRSNQATAVMVTVATTALLAVIVAVWILAPGPSRVTLARSVTTDLWEAAALVFVAFTGYGRVATMGEEVREPARIIPVAVMVTVALTGLLYGLVAFVESRFYTGGTPGGSLLTMLAELTGSAGLVAYLRIGALAALVGVLLNLVLGLSRVALAMGRRGDLPSVFARIDRKGRTPTVAVLGVALVVAGFALIGDIRTTWSFSALTVLLYYALTNLSALRLPTAQRRFSPVIPIVGLLGCLSLAVFIEGTMWLWGGGLVAIGLVWHGIGRWNRGLG